MLPVINCAKCKKPVDQVLVRRNRLLCQTTFTALCHGQEQEVVLRDMDLAKTFKLTVTDAFQPTHR